MKYVDNSLKNIFQWLTFFCGNSVVGNSYPEESKGRHEYIRPPAGDIHRYIHQSYPLIDQTIRQL